MISHKNENYFQYKHEVYINNVELNKRVLLMIQNRFQYIHKTLDI